MMSCKKCKRLPKDLLKLEYVAIDDVEIIPFLYKAEEPSTDCEFVSPANLPVEIVDMLRTVDVVKHDGYIYFQTKNFNEITVKKDNEQYYRKLYNKYQYVIDYLVKNKGNVVKTVDIPATFDCFNTKEIDFPYIRSDDSINIFIYLKDVNDSWNGYIRNTNVCHLANLTLRDPKVVTTTSSISDIGENIITTTVRMVTERPLELTQEELLVSPRSDVITKWYNESGSNIHSCNSCNREFSHIIHDFKYIIITKVTPCSPQIVDSVTKKEIHHSLVPLKVKGVLEPGMSIIHDGFIYTYEYNSNKEMSYKRVPNETEKSLNFHNKYSETVKDISKYIGIVIKPAQLGIEKNVYAVNVPVIYMGKDNIGLVIKRDDKYSQISTVLTTLATIEFQFVFA